MKTLDTVKKGTVLSPAITIIESNTEYRIEADVPGVDIHDVSVSVENNVLTLHAEQKGSYDGYQALVTERTPCVYNREFRLADTIDTENISASMKHGVLHITLAKKPEVQPKSIKIEVA